MGPRRPDHRPQDRLLPHPGPVALPGRRYLPAVRRPRAALVAGHPRPSAVGPSGGGVGPSLPGELQRRAAAGGRPLRDRGGGGAPTGRRGSRQRSGEEVGGSSPASSCASPVFCPYKNVEAVAAAFRRLPDLRLVVVGTGPLADQISATAPANVTSLGRVDDASLRWLYGSSSVWWPPPTRTSA